MRAEDSDEGEKPQTVAAVDAALAASDIRSAVAMAEAAVAAGDNDPGLLHLAAWARGEDGAFAAAHALLARALIQLPGDPGLLTTAGSLLRREGRLGDALRVLDRVVGATPDYARAWLERGFAFDDGGSLRPAAESYARAAALDPHSGPALAGSALIAARTGDRVSATDLAARALALDPLDAVATRAAATAEIESGDPRTAAMRLQRLLDTSDLDAGQRIDALTLLGDAHDRLDAAADAFAAYEEANATFALLHAHHFPEGPTQRLMIERLTAASLPRRTFADVTPTRARAHVFLTGYPRSGNTLVENILASAPEVVALEERPTLAAADAAFLGDAAGLNRLAALDMVIATRLQAAYWDKATTAGGPLTDRVLVDMDPLKAIKLPVIARLFPAARVVIVRRDPRDVVWSCFRRNFRLSAAAYEFSELETAARHYDALMRLTEATIAALPVAALVVRYEDLVADFDAVTQQLCAFTGIGWTPEMRRFDRTARARGVSTASAGQVRRGLFDGSGQWRRYEAALAPVLPVLQPWVERFGYA